MSNLTPKLRCAIYTRKSSDEGLDQSFNSLDAQREACEAYIASQASLGWQVIPDLYDDGGISGATMQRPALQRLLADITSRKVDIVVVYKIDRLTRALSDFSRIVEIFDQAGVSFVSITQQFNTTTSMGRLTLNVLLSFAQFEREVTAERIRDKVAASKKKGMWMGGNVPLGYAVRDRKLVIDADEATTVRWLFTRYLDVKSLNLLAGQARTAGLYRRADRKSVALPFGRGNLHHLLTNPVYTGKVRHKDAIYDGEHEAIISEEVFARVKALLEHQGPVRRSSTNTTERHLLAGLLHDDDNRPFVVAYAQNHGKRYRYYVSAPGSAQNLATRTSRPGPTGPYSGSGSGSGEETNPGAGAVAGTGSGVQSGSRTGAGSSSGNGSGSGYGTGAQSGTGSAPVLGSGKGWRIASTTIEPVIGEQFRLILADRTRLAIWAEQHGAMPQLAEIIGNARLMAQQYAHHDDQAVRRSLLRHLFHRIIMRSGSIILELTPARLINRLLAFSINSSEDDPRDSRGDNEDRITGTGVIETIVLPLTIRRRGVESRIILDGPQEQAACHDPALIGLVARAHVYLKALTDGSGTGIGALAERHGLSGSDISRILPMAFLSPRITHSILTGTQPAGLTIARLTRLLDLPVDWQQQQAMLEL